MNVRAIIRSLAIVTAFGLSVPMTVAAAPAPKPAATPPAIEPKALDILKTSLDKIQSAQTLSFTAVELFETLSRQGQPLTSATKYSVTMQRPDKLRIITPGDGLDRQFYYDGKTVVAYAPKENLTASAAAPPTIDAMLEAVYKIGANYFPFTDIIVANPFGDLRSGLKMAYYVGQSNVVGGVTTDEVAYVDEGVFIQTWISTDDKLPRLIRAVYLSDPAKLRHELSFSDWQLNPVLAADTFTGSIPAGAKRVPFEPLRAKKN